MITLSKGAILAGAGALLLGGSLALSSVGAASGAGEIQPDKSSSCTKKGPCTSITNGRGPAIYAASQSSHLNSAAAVEAVANGLIGMHSYSALETGGWSESGSTSYAGFYASSDAGTGYPFEAYDSSTGNEFYTDESGDGFFDGSVTASTYYTAERTRDGGRVGSFLAQSTRATIEDSGTARMMSGEAAVRFDSAFARTIDARAGYQVFLTPDGDTRGLYIASKYEGGFIVREIEHGRSSISFDYRVIARPYGASEARLPEINLRRPLRPDRR